MWANDGGAVEERVDRAGRSEEAVGGRAAADWGRAVQQLNLGEAAAGAAVPTLSRQSHQPGMGVHRQDQPRSLRAHEPAAVRRLHRTLRVGAEER